MFEDAISHQGSPPIHSVSIDIEASSSLYSPIQKASSSPLKTTIVCGMLGSGKTTFIQNSLKNMSEKSVVLVNDFGQTGIDGEILSADGIETIELPSGCVCCTLKFDLITTIEKVLQRFQPERLLIEPSGVASPSGVVEILASLNISPVIVIGIVDATEFIDFYQSEMYGSFFLDQITNSDIILVNKIDLVDRERTQKTVSLLATLNERAVIFATIWAAIDTIPDVDHRKIPSGEERHLLHFDTLTISLKESTPYSRVENFFQDMATGKFGAIIRAKGLVQTGSGPYRFDLASGRFAAVPVSNLIKASRLVIIGNNLKESRIRSFLSSSKRR